jgi:DNA-binding beta-propeller fold protein YncE
VAQFGSAGFEAGQFSEPVGITIDASNWVFVADTWNQRMQVFAPDETGNNFIPAVQWDISGWFGESLENKPFISVSNDALVFVADPEGARILVFDQDGKYLNNWGNYSSGPDGFGLVGGLAADNQGGVWAADAGNHRIMHFTLPQ